MIKYKNKGRTIVYRKGQSRTDVILELEKRIAKRQKELDKRQWLYDEYKNLLSKQVEDNRWLSWLKTQTDDEW